MVGRIIDDYLAGIESGRIVVPNFGAYIKRNGGEKVFVDLFRSDDGVLAGLIMGRLKCDATQAQALIVEYIAEQRGESKVAEASKNEPKSEPKSEIKQEAEVISDVKKSKRKREDKQKDKKVAEVHEDVALHPSHRKKADPIKILALVAIGCVIGLVVVAFIINGGESIGL